LRQTALRETEEEIGITIDPKDVLGALEPVLTLSTNFIIRPFITVLDSMPEPRIYTNEVENVIDAPLIDLLQSIDIDYEHSNPSASKLYRFAWSNNIIWGATARILKRLHSCFIKD
jgi:8-oxo-dGTP pyrophosphatase MutT (NUDIX family)